MSELFLANSGLFPVVLRQSANSAVRFSSYSSLKSLVQGSTRPGEQLPTAMTFLLGAAAGTITVYCEGPSPFSEPCVVQTSTG
jgi:solute carrier family 25 citrate transporter 1